MDLNKRLEEEKIFFSIDALRKKRIEKLNSIGVVTILDFINMDVDSTIKTQDIAKQYRMFQKILRAKYMNEPLATDVLLYNSLTIKKRSRGDNSIAIDNYLNIERFFEKLGFDRKSEIKGILIDNVDKECSVIDLLNQLANVPYECQGKYISQFYIDYVNKKKNIEKENPSTQIEKLKQEYLMLTQQRDELDSKIATLSEQLATLEGGQIGYGRK